ncbi:MAG: glycosyltransferase [Candidatus Eremiobacteraeota bacterium]|nr:glycosyltransferase [Candidatus Eremiobacteraeota bacterium]
MQQAKKTLSIVTPVFYNAGSLPELFSELVKVEEQLAARGVGLELIFVNDGSGDDSLGELLAIKRARPATKVISLSRNFGAVPASKRGFSFVTGDAFMTLAADLQDPPEQITVMTEHWLAGSKFVVAARATRKDPVTSVMWSWLYYRIIEWFVLPGYPKGGYDLMLMDRAMLPYMAGSTKNTNPNVYAYWLGFTPKIVLYDRRERQHGKSRWRFSQKVKFFFDTICGFTVFPIRFMSLLGMIAAVVSVLYGLNIAIAASQGRVPVQGFATLAALISFFSGLILVMLGTLGEYLWRVFDAVGNKPESVIDEAYL